MRCYVELWIYDGDPMEGARLLGQNSIQWVGGAEGYNKEMIVDLLMIIIDAVGSTVAHPRAACPGCGNRDMTSLIVDINEDGADDITCEKCGHQHPYVDPSFT